MKVTPRVTEVKALDEQRLYLKFADGKEKIYDMKDLINNNKFYNNLRDKEYFNRVKPRGVTVEWPNGEDVCPENLYYESTAYANKK
ncbi:MAG: DUF2442 domain-containing protein [Clostridia bacterium]|nr:DUF2442 domain-containing protein [Clostridia bacterium]